MATGGATDERWTIEKLDGETNWNTWKFQMKHLLLAKDLWGFVDGTEPIPTEAATEEVKADYRKRSQKAFSVIVLAITSSQLYLVTSCEQPREAWDRGSAKPIRARHAGKPAPFEKAIFSIGDEGGYINRAASQAHEGTD